jgi:hypothetical protein
LFTHSVTLLVFVDFELSDAQYMHALAVEHLVPSLPDLKVQICSTVMSEACFWKIYFVLLHSKLSKKDAVLLSTPQVILNHPQHFCYDTLFLILLWIIMLLYMLQWMAWFVN